MTTLEKQASACIVERETWRGSTRHWAADLLRAHAYLFKRKSKWTWKTRSRSTSWLSRSSEQLRVKMSSLLKWGRCNHECSSVLDANARTPNVWSCIVSVWETKQHVAQLASANRSKVKKMLVKTTNNTARKERWPSEIYLKGTSRHSKTKWTKISLNTLKGANAKLQTARRNTVSATKGMCHAQTNASARTAKTT